MKYLHNDRSVHEKQSQNFRWDKTETRIDTYSFQIYSVNEILERKCV